MAHRLALALVLLLPCVAFAILPGAAAVVGPTDVISLIDYLTHKDSMTKVEVKPGTVAASNKVLIARMRVDVELDRSSRNWRGTVAVRMTVPSDVTYSVDLSAIKPEHVSIDKDNKSLTITMPTPRVEDVTPALTEVKEESKYKGVRFRLTDRRFATQLQNDLLLHDYQSQARKAAEAQIPAATQQGRPQLEAFLQGLFKKARPDLTIHVR
jgi:hypothetical protein